MLNFRGSLNMQKYKSNIFVSYAREDFDTIKPICDLLRNLSFNVWIDVEKILLGQKWELEIEKAIDNSDLFLACLSTNSVNKTGYVQKELKKALDIYEKQPEDKIWLIPIRLDDCAVPQRIKAIPLLSGTLIE